MTKVDIAREISISTGIDRVTVLKTVEAFMESIKRSMVSNQNVYLRDFGSFIVTPKAQKTARNITKNTTVIVPAHKAPKFKPAKSFVAKIKENVK